MSEIQWKIARSRHVNYVFWLDNFMNMFQNYFYVTALHHVLKLVIHFAT